MTALCLLSLVLLLGLYEVRRQKLIRALADLRDRSSGLATGAIDKELPRYEFQIVDEVASAINQLRSELNRLERIRRDFVANVSHELKTPVTSIKGFAETLIDGAMHDPEDARRFLNIVRTQADRLGAIINDLLTLSRLESDNLSDILLIQDEQLLEIIRSAVEACAVHSADKNMKIRVDCNSGVIVRGDRSLLVQAVINLVENAIKYSNAGSMITICGRNTGLNSEIDVVDEGVGIADEHLPRLFERFYRIDQSRSRLEGGTGLGLAIVKHIAAVHNGSVAVTSMFNKGSTFSIRIPNGENPF